MVVVAGRCSDTSIAAGCGDHAIAVCVKVKPGLGLLSNFYSKSRTAKGMLRNLVSICAPPRTSWEVFPVGAMPDTARTDDPIWLMEEPQWICCLGFPRHPHQLPALGFTVPKQQRP